MVKGAASPVQTLVVQGLEKSYGEVEVLKSISIDMKAGDFLVLVGPSGTGLICALKKKLCLFLIPRANS